MTGPTQIRTLAADDLAAEVAAGRAGAAVGALMDSLRTGFVWVGRPLPYRLLDRAYDAVRALFALEDGAKAALAPGDVRDNGGYRGLASERATGAPVADWKETFQWCTDLAPTHPLRVRFPHRYPRTAFPDDDTRQVLTRLGTELLACQATVLRAVVLGLGAHPSVADDLLLDADVATRALHYPSLPADAGGGSTRAAAHTDINLITALPPATGPGLEVLVGDEWVPADPPPGCLVLNTGQMLDRVSNGSVPAGVHRVVPGAERWSFAQFCHPAPWTVLAPLAATVGPRSPQRFVPMAAADVLDRVLWEIRTA